MYHLERVDDAAAMQETIFLPLHMRVQVIVITLHPEVLN